MEFEILDPKSRPVNRIVASLEYMQANYPDENYRQIVLPEAEPEPEPVPQYAHYIDIGPFYDRFGSAKLDILLQQDTKVKALIADINIRKWVDLKLPAVAQALAYIGTVVPTLTPELQAEVLNPVVHPDENLALRQVYFNTATPGRMI